MTNENSKKTVEIDGVKMTIKPDNVVALGEATGHAHTLYGEGVEVYAPEQGGGPAGPEVMFIHAPLGFDLRHVKADGAQAEHHPQTIPGREGGFTRELVREVDPITNMTRSVRD